MSSQSVPPRGEQESVERCKVVVIDDDRLIRTTLAHRLRELGHQVAAVATGREGIEEIAAGADVIALDYRLPDGDGFEFLGQIRHRWPDVPVIMMTGYASIDHAVGAMQSGAHDYVAKPASPDAVAAAVARALADTRLARQARNLASRGHGQRAIDNIIGDSESIRELKALLPRIARSHATTVLITGESGTGKDLVARALHAESTRADGEFVNITCSALPSQLLESELFGHERGAFTDAKVRKEGLLERANHGTVFLDEICEMEPQLQAKLLRFLEEKTFRRVGGADEIHADVRVVAATNVDLRQAVLERQFREDLYYRLAVVTVELPALREREGDIERLVAFFVDRFKAEFDKQVQAVSPSALRALIAHPWPGNVRELRNAVERAVLLSTDPVLTERDFDVVERTSADSAVVRLPACGIDVREVERSLVEQALERTGGNKTRAAELLGMNRDQVRYRMRRYGLSGDKDIG